MEGFVNLLRELRDRGANFILEQHIGAWEGNEGEKKVMDALGGKVWRVPLLRLSREEGTSVLEYVKRAVPEVNRKLVEELRNTRGFRPFFIRVLRNPSLLSSKTNELEVSDTFSLVIVGTILSHLDHETQNALKSFITGKRLKPSQMRKIVRTGFVLRREEGGRFFIPHMLGRCLAHSFDIPEEKISTSSRTLGRGRGPSRLKRMRA